MNYRKKVNFGGMNEAQILQIAVAIIINSQNKMLVVQKQSSTYYQLPGGKIEVDEEAIDALCRELKEELNLPLAKEQLNLLGIHEAKAVNEVGKTVRGYVFKVDISETQQDLKPHAELKEVHWLAKEEIADFKLDNLMKEFALPHWLQKQN